MKTSVFFISMVMLGFGCEMSKQNSAKQATGHAVHTHAVAQGACPHAGVKQVGSCACADCKAGSGCDCADCKAGSGCDCVDCKAGSGCDCADCKDTATCRHAKDGTPCDCVQQLNDGPSFPKELLGRNKRDPVCGMQVKVADNSQYLKHGEQHLFFCCEDCKELFLEKPQHYLKKHN